MTTIAIRHVLVIMASSAQVGAESRGRWVVVTDDPLQGLGSRVSVESYAVQQGQRECRAQTGEAGHRIACSTMTDGINADTVQSTQGWLDQYRRLDKGPTRLVSPHCLDKGSFSIVSKHTPSRLHASFLLPVSPSRLSSLHPQR